MRVFALLPALALASLSFGLGVGDKAPLLKVETIVKGKAVDLNKGVHVVEFWATWCGPCKATIPHLTELAKKFKGKADFTGISISEQGENPLVGVKKFVADMGPKMDYNVAYDGKAAYMATNWMDAAQQEGIPTAFVVKDGVILWIGHPMNGLDGLLDKAVSGKYGVTEAKAELAAAQAKEADVQALTKPFVEAMQKGDLNTAMTALDALVGKYPDMKPQVEPTRFMILAQAGDERLVPLAKKYVAEDFKDDAETLNSLAWSIVDPESKLPKPNFEAALILAKRAAEASQMKSGQILDTYALALFKTGDKAKAIEIQTKAVELIKADKEADPETVKELEARLAEFKKTP